MGDQAGGGIYLRKVIQILREGTECNACPPHTPWAWSHHLGSLCPTLHYSMGSPWEGRWAYWRAVVGVAGPKLLSAAVAASAEAPAAGTEVETRSRRLNLKLPHPLLTSPDPS